MQAVTKTFKQKKKRERWRSREEHLHRLAEKKEDLSRGIFEFCLKDVAPDKTKQCPYCNHAFHGAAALASHVSKHHGIPSMATQMAHGTVCQVCLQNFWGQFRLREHLRRSRECLAAYIGSDIGTASCELTPAEHSWRPAVRVQGPRPWWATLQPPIVLDDQPERPSCIVTGAAELARLCEIKPEDNEAVQDALQGFMQAMLNQRATVEDLPVGCLRTGPHKDLVQVAANLAALACEQSSGYFRRGRVKGSFQWPTFSFSSEER